MNDDTKQRAIIAQNAGTSAATIYAAELTATGGTFDADRYEAIRSTIFNGVLELAAIEAVVVGTTDQPVKASGSSAPRGGGNSDVAFFTLNFGKNRGKALKDIDRDYLEWVAENSNNEFAVSKVREYLAA